MNREPIIDVHLHAPPPEDFQGALDAPATPEQHMRQTLDLLERLNIRGVTSGPRECVRQWCQAAPDRIIPGVTVFRPEEINLGWVEEAFASGDLAVLGEIWTQVAGFAPDDPALEPVFALAERLDIPVGYHVGPCAPGAAYVGYPGYRASLSNPLLLEEVLIRHPRLRLYVMHAAWPMLDAMINLLYSHPQVYVDTGVIDWFLPREEFHTYLRRIVQAGFGDRVMFGSDEMVWPQAIPKAIEAIECAGFLSEDQKRDILYRNAARFLQLDR
jgi:hypothetical protein